MNYYLSSSTHGMQQSGWWPILMSATSHNGNQHEPLFGKSWKIPGKIFSKISVLRIISQNVLLENSSNFSEIPILRSRARPFTGKLIHANFINTYSAFVNYRVWNWRTDPNMDEFSSNKGWVVNKTMEPTYLSFDG